MEINIKEKLRALRQQKNVTQEALAKHLGITPQSVGKLERGWGNARWEKRVGGGGQDGRMGE